MKEKISILKSEIKKDGKQIEMLLDKFAKAYSAYLESEEYSKLIESAFYVNQLCTGFECMFKNVAKTFENNIEQNYWHKSLLERMSLEIENIRPAFISEDSLKCLDELRSFRHFFRYAYNTDIDKDKFRIVADRVFKIKVLFKKDVKKFIQFLDKLLESL